MENNNYQGLTSAEAQARLLKYGPNSRRKQKSKTWLKRFLGIAGEPMMLLLFITAGVYFFIGDQFEAFILLLSIIPILLMEFFQEQRTDEAVKMLDKALVEFCLVQRDGQLVKLEIKYLVPGDLVYVTAGDKLSADGLLVNSPGLLVDESILTGETLPVAKEQVELAVVEDKNNFLSQGTLVTQGEGYLLVKKTGENTTYGQLGNLLAKITQIKTPLQQKIHHLVSYVAVVALFAAIVCGVVLSISHGWVEGLLGGLTIAISLIPEEFPVVFSVFLIMGVWRMTKKNALTRDMVMVETLGSATVICTDKTGTLTEGKLTIKNIFLAGKLILAEEIKNNQVITVDFIKNVLLSLEQVAIDPIEVEAQRFAVELGIDVVDFYRDFKLIKDIPFDSKTKLVTHIWQDKQGQKIQYSAGAPEAVINFCQLSLQEKEEIEAAFAQMSSEGQRVIAVARMSLTDDQDIMASGGWQFGGLIAMSDPLRAGVKEAIDTCQEAGIRIIMITGDNPLTAHSVAEHSGLNHNEQIITGAELENLSPAALQEIVKRHDIFARVYPEQKYLIVESLQALGEVVAMTGDGVNDAPALKKANIGIAMGQKGTEVARASAGIILLDDNFATIVNAVKEGRRIYDNLRQAFAFLFSFHIPIVGITLIPVLFGFSMIFMPIHIIFLELICDPASVLGFERERSRRGLMKESPRLAKEPLINPALWRKIILQGLGITAVCLGFFYFYDILVKDEAIARTLTFGALVLSQLALILFTREWQQVKQNTLLLIIPALTLLFLLTSFYLPAVRVAFHFVAPTFIQFICMFGSALIFGLFAKGLLLLGKARQ